MKTLWRKTWLLFALPFLAPIAFMLWKSLTPPDEVVCAKRVEVSIGNFSSYTTGQRASLQRLAIEIKRCPQAQLFSILRDNSGLKDWAEDEHHQTSYNRKNGLLQDGSPLFGATTQWLNVTDQAVIEAANSGGNINDLAKVGAKYSMP